jgi:agmatinase
MEKEKTFAGFPSCIDLVQLQADIALIGIPYGTPYVMEKPLHSLHSPNAIRRESNRYKEDPVAWDFDLGGTLLGDSGIRVTDCGDLPGNQDDPEGNRERAKAAVASILAKNAIPLVLGGDDSVPIPVMRAYAGVEPFHVLQLDAHIDWRDSVAGVREGYSSTMRRASELEYVAGIVQAGMRGVGSARVEEHRAASNYGAEIVLAKTLMGEGADAVLRHIPEDGRCFLTIDFDVLDPSAMPAVGAPTPGGLDYQTLIDIIQGAAARVNIVGVCLVEFVPEADLHNLGAVTAMRVVWNVIGALARAMT